MKKLTSEAQQLFHLTRVGRYVLHRIPSDIYRYRTWNAMPSIHRTGLLRAADAVFRRVTQYIFPKDGRGLYEQYLKEKGGDPVVMRMVARGVRKARKGSNEKRLLISLLFASLPCDRVHELLCSGNWRDVFGRLQNVQDNEDSDWSIGEAIDSSDDEFDDDDGNVNERDGLTGEYGREGERPRRVDCGNENAEAYWSQETGTTAQQSQESLSSDSTHNRIKSIYRSGYIARLQKKSRDDWIDFIENGRLQKRRRTRCHFDDDVVRTLVNFILRADNCQMLAWGTRRVRIHGQFVTFPSILRKSGMEELWRKYNLELGMSRSSGKVGRTSFLGVLGKLTKTEVKAMGCIDYFQYTLVHENLKLMCDVVKNEIENVSSKKRSLLCRKLDAIATYLKYSYSTHVCKGSAEPIHSMEFAVLGGKGPEKREIRCPTCIVPFQVLQEVNSFVPKRKAHVKAAITEAAHKVELYMGHKIRAAIQERRKQEIHDGMMKADPGEECIAYLDYKMKYVPKRYRDPSNLWFGKRGMSWHGTGVFHVKTGEETAKEEENIRNGRSWGSGRNLRRRSIENAEHSPVGIFFIDHVVQNSNLQNVAMTLNILDAVCYRVKLQLPSCKFISLVTDNANSYQNNTFPLLAYFICKEHGLSLRVVLHPDSQDGKCLVDAHFAVSSRVVDRYITSTQLQVETPDDLVTALTYNGGVKKTAVDMICIERRFELLDAWKKGVQDGKIINLRRRGEVQFYDEGDGLIRVEAFNYSYGARDVFLLSKAMLKKWDVSHETKCDVIIRSCSKRKKSTRCGNRSNVVVPVDEERAADVDDDHNVQQSVDVEESDEGDQDECYEADGEDLPDDFIDESAQGRCSEGVDHVITDENGEEEEIQIDNDIGDDDSEAETRGDDLYSRRTPVHTCIATSVQIKFLGTMLPWDRKYHVGCTLAMQHASAELDAEGELMEDHSDSDSELDAEDSNKERGCKQGNNNGRYENGRVTTNSSNRGEVIRKDIICGPHLDCVNDMVNSLGVTTHKCDSCERIFRNIRGLNMHLGRCSGALRTKSVSERAVELAMDHIFGGSEVSVYQKDDTIPYLQQLDNSEDREELVKKLRQGWGLRPKNGQTLGENNVEFFKPYIKRWFDMGTADKSRRMSAGLIRRGLRALFPRRYDIPSEQQIRNVLSKFVRHLKETIIDDSSSKVETEQVTVITRSSQRPENTGDEVPNVDRQSDDENSCCDGDDDLEVERCEGDSIVNRDDVVREDYESNECNGESTVGRKKVSSPMVERYANAILAILTENPGIKRAAVYDRLVSRLDLDRENLPLDFPTEEKVKVKFSNFKRRLRGKKVG